MKLINISLKQYLTILLFFSTISIIKAQKIIGFWEVTKVEVGDKLMTPLAKWTKINSDGTFQSGNGWLQNAEGSWTFDNKRSTFSPIETNGIFEDFGPFHVDFKEEMMIWEREEEGMMVKVFLKKITKLPKATADEIVGLWDLVKATKNEKDATKEFDSQNRNYLFLRWDRIYVERNSTKERTTGYWYINAHHPEITFLSHEPGLKPESWHVIVSDTTLILEGISDTNKELKLFYTRTNRFPQ